MSRGLGVMQGFIIATLRNSEGMTLAALHRQYLGIWPTEHRRSARNSMARALRGLEMLRKVRRDDIGVWRLTGKPPGVDERRLATAYHEAGHAVIGLAVGLPIAYACVGGAGAVLGHVSNARPAAPVGDVYKTVKKTIRRGRHTYADWDFVKVAELSDVDAFGNPYREREWAPEQHHGEVIMCIAGGMAEAKHQSGKCDWRELASSSDMSIARHHRRELGDKTKAWEHYVEETRVLVDRHWSLIEAVAARLMKVDFVGVGEIDRICRRVVRRQHLKGQA